MRKIAVTAGLMILLSSFVGCTNHGTDVKTDGSENSFSFAFLTDVHLNANNPDISSKGLRQALEHAKSKEVDFVLIYPPGYLCRFYACTLLIPLLSRCGGRGQGC